MSDSDLQRLIDEYARGEVSLDAVAEALDARVRDAPEDASGIPRLLEQARRTGLDERARAALEARVRDVLAGLRSGDDRTRVLPGGTGGRTRSPTHGAPPSRDDETERDADRRDERTRVLPGGTGGKGVSGESSDTTSAALDPGEDDTQVRVDGDARAADATQVHRAAPAGEEIFDPTAAPEPDETLVQTDSPATASDTPGAAPHASSPETAREPEAGLVIRGRFRLIEPLGEGGMGAVWKAVDKVKEEARDRNPFVAVKLLVGDFRDHPEAFIALQRESAKQQRLAHPNIATVYDFDRDGDTVYMTMEVMTGTPMDKFIRQLPAEGLPYEEAMPIIEELGAGLAYAHQADLVHSDLKPGNAFLTQDNHVKLLDFGIARASKTRTDAEGEKTLFDPGQLGALTPTYATIEMFEGMDPDPRDDIYAMAIIAYQLFTGKHPYGKKPAPKAKELGLVPEPVEKLTKRQNQALLRGLALEREDRTPSVEEFLEGLRPFKSKLPWIVGGSIAAALVIGVLAYKPVVEYVERQEREEIIEVFMQGGQENIDRGMGMVAELEDPAQREAIAADPRTRKAIIDLHVKRREEHFDPERERWDYAAAVEVMDELSSLYPDSAEVLTLRTELEREKNQVLGELASRYARLLEEGEVVPDPEGEDITDVREVVARVDPDNALLDDPRLGERYASVARESMEAGEWERAEEVLVAGRALVAETEELAGLRSRVEGELARIAEERRVAALEDRLEGRSFDSLGAYEEVRAELRELFALRPTHPLLEGAAPGLAEVLGEELARARDAGELEEARARLVAWAPVLGLERVHGYRAALTEAGAGAGSERELAERVERIEGLVAEPVFDARWEARVRAGYAELLALGGAGAEAVARMRERIASLYLERAQAAREAERFDDALALLERGGVFAPGKETFAAEREAVVAAREDKRRREAEARRLARIEQMKSTLRAHAEAGRVPEARAVLGELRAELPAGDAFLAREGPEAIARSSLRLARAAFERGEREAALAGVRAGLEVAPGHAGLEGAREEYRAAVVARALALQRRRARALAPSAAPEARAATRPAPALSGAGLAPPEAPAPRTSTAAPPRAERYPALGPALAATLAERVTARAREAIEEQEWRRAREVLVAGRALVAETEELAGLRSRVEGELARIAEERRVAALEDRLEGRSFDSLGAYEEVRAELRELFALRPTHPLLEGAAPGLAEVLGEELARARDAGELEGARARLVAWAPVLGLERVRGYRAALTEAGAGAGGERELAERVERVERIEGLVAEPVFDARWEARVRAGYAELLALGGAGAEAVARMRERIASLYLERAQAAREAERFDDALALLERGGVFAPGKETFAAEREAVVAAREDKRRREAEARRLARIEQMKSTLRAHAEAGRVPEARAVLGELRAELPAGDAFLAREGPEAIARSSLRLARAAFERGEREAALAGVRAGLEVAPGHAGLEGAREEYRAAVVARALALQRRRARALAPSAAPEARAATRPAPALSGAGLAPPEAPAPRTSTAAPPRAERYPALGPALAATLAERVTARAREAIEEQEWRRAREVLVAGRALVAETEELAGLRSRVEGELARIAEERRVAALEDRLEGRSFDSLGAYEEVRAELRELFALRPTHPLLEGAAPGLAEVLGEELARARDAGELEGARARLVAWAPVLGLERVRGYRAALTEAGAGAGGERELAERVERIEGLVAEPVFDARWEARVRAGYAELLALGGAGAEAVARMRERIASLYLERAQAAREAERFDDALALLERGGVFAPGRETFAAEREAVVAAREDKRRREAEARRLARIEQMKSTLRAHAEAGRVPEARAVLGELRAELPAGDAFLAREGPEAIARSSLRLARAAFERGEREAALAGVRAGLEVAPGHAGLEGAREEYRAAVVARALALQRRRARALAPSAAPEARAATRPAPALSGAGLAPPEPSPAADGAMSANGAHAPPLAGLDARVAERVAERIAAGAKGSPREVAALAGPAAGFRTLFPRRYDALAGDIEQTLAARLERMAKAKDVKGHNTLLAAAKRIPVLRGRADIEGPKPSKLLAELGLSQVEDGALGAALETASKVASEQPDATNLEEFRDTIAKRKSQAGEYYEKFERYAKAQRLRTAKQYLERALALWSDNPTYTASLAKLEETAAVRRGACVASLAGYGRRRRGTCHDEVAGAKGPAMVVVPAADGSSPFAIGKYEVTVADFNRYCKASGACQALPGDPGLPATGLSLEAMRAYASWLSEHTGATYRLPTEAEWEHAAKAGGKQPRKDFNCRVTQGGSVVKGHSLVSAESGSQNAWGLANYVGNAREVVTTSNGLATRGGAYTDSLVECDVGMRGTDLASPAQDTGFRLVREIG